MHRDLKPANLLLGAAGPYVIDFGIARAADSTQLTRTGGVIGTPQYMSPEHALGAEVTTASDLFAVGLIAAVAATGQHPYGNGGATAVGVRIANTERLPPDLSGHPAGPRPLLECCLTADPAARIGTDELAALCELAAGRPLNEFSGWLPEPVGLELARRVRAALHPPVPTVADGDGSKDDAKSPAARQEASPSASSSAAYTVVFQDKPLTLRAPSSGTGTHVDLDAPKVRPNGKIGKIPDMELTYQTWSDEGLEFLTATGKSPGSTPEECREAVGADTMPSKLYGDQLRPGKVLPKETVLCTVTSDGNLAMLRITDVLIDTSRSALNPVPDYVTTLTLWKTG